MEKQYIYIIQMHTKTVPARFVKLMTRYRYSHVGICLEKDCDTLYSFGRRSLRNILNGGFVAEVLSRAEILKFDKKICMIRPKDFAKQDWKEIYTGKYTLYHGDVAKIV